jgi:hypothetical protein
VLVYPAKRAHENFLQWLSPHLRRWLVLPLAQIHDLSQQAIFRPVRLIRSVQ